MVFISPQDAVTPVAAAGQTLPRQQGGILLWGHTETVATVWRRENEAVIVPAH